VAPYASCGGTTKMRLPPLRMPTKPWSQPRITLPAPSVTRKVLEPSMFESKRSPGLPLASSQPRYLTPAVSPVAMA